jgi:glycosyltransferase involved in cell wall biosynthesis
MPNADPHRMAAVVEKFLTDPVLAARLRSRARTAVLAKWSKAAAAARLEEVLYKSLH